MWEEKIYQKNKKKTRKNLHESWQLRVGGGLFRYHTPGNVILRILVVSVIG